MKISSLLGGAITTLLFLLSPTTAVSSPGAENLVTGTALLSEIEALHTSLSLITKLLSTAEIPDDEEVMKKAAKLVRRVRSLVSATSQYQKEGQRIIKLKKRALLRGHSVEEAEQVAAAMMEEQEVARAEEEGDRHLVQYEDGEEADDVRRDLVETTISFPECREKFLEECIDILHAQLLELDIEAQLITLYKRKEDDAEYNKVVIVTDLTAATVKGRTNDGMVQYPFSWKISDIDHRTLGVEGKWNCLGESPEDCCAAIKTSAPDPDMNGNYIACHIFVPIGGAGNPKKGDRIFINKSLDGRVQETPILQ